MKMAEKNTQKFPYLTCAQLGIFGPCISFFNKSINHDRPDFTNDYIKSEITAFKTQLQFYPIISGGITFQMNKGQ